MIRKSESRVCGGCRAEKKRLAGSTVLSCYVSTVTVSPHTCHMERQHYPQHRQWTEHPKICGIKGYSAGSELASDGPAGGAGIPTMVKLVRATIVMRS